MNPASDQVYEDLFGLSFLEDEGDNLFPDLPLPDASPSPLSDELALVAPSSRRPVDSDLSTHARSPNLWEPKLVIDVAMGMDTEEEILDRYGLNSAELRALMQLPEFRRELATTMRSLREEGLTFKRKAATQAESYLEIIDEIVHDKSTASQVKLSCVQSMVKWGQLEPKDEKNGNANGTVVNVQINF